MEEEGEEEETERRPTFGQSHRCKCRKKSKNTWKETIPADAVPFYSCGRRSEEVTWEEVGYRDAF